SIRVSTKLQDEIGLLYHKFNEMLVTVQFHQKEKDKALMELIESQAKLNAIIANSNAIVYLKDTNGKYLIVNKQYEEALGIHSKYLIGKTDEEIFPEEVSMEYLEADQKVLTEQKAMQFEEVQPHADGHLHAYLSLKFPVRDAENNVFAIGCFSTDITERKQTELELENYRNNLEELVGQRTAELEMANQALNQTNEKLSSQKEKLEQTVLKLKTTREKLIESEKLASLGMLTAGIAHEINNPVNYISSGLEGLKAEIQDVLKYLELLNRYKTEDTAQWATQLNDLAEQINSNELMEAIGHLIKNIQIGVDRTSEIISGLRIFSRLDESYFSEVDIHETIDAALIMLYNKYKGNIEIEKNYGNVPGIECLPGKINQVLVNIISNAIDAIEENGKIIIGTSYAGDKVTISVSDTGTGIAKELRNKIFEPFFTTKDVGKGTGLGLSISYGIVKDHKGDIEVVTEPGEGTTMHIVLPVKQNMQNAS
ncbi:MAG: PAS domain-containing protein, partial [Bacteroidales bacterium]|nr:PAS domain-containing protein [Bacteroidales bacterium]